MSNINLLEVLIALMSAILVFFLFMGIMSLYFVLKRHYIHKKLAAELGILIPFVIILIITRYLLSRVGQPATVTLESIKQTPGMIFEIFSNIIESTFNTLGGLTFEGVESAGGLSGEYNEVRIFVLKAIYYGLSILATLVFLGTISSKISYEIYSYIYNLFLPKGHLWLRKTDYYIFMDATEDTVTLATSIKEKYKNKIEGEKRRCLIYFSGDELEAFDNKNAIHREIMARNYLYISYIKRMNKSLSILKRLHIRVNNDILDKSRKAKDPNGSVHIFAFGYNKTLAGQESENSSKVFDEIKYGTRKMLLENNKKCPIINFYVLSNNNINYEYYHRHLDYIINEEIEKEEIKEEKNINKLYKKIKKYAGKDLAAYIKSHFQVHIISEAVLVGKNLIAEREKVLIQCGDSSDFIKDTEQKTYKAMALGFGGNGQQALKELYVSTAYVYDDKAESQFVADIYDPSTDKISGIFGYSHPLFTCVDCDALDEKEIEKEFQKEEERIIKLYQARINQVINKEEDYSLFKEMSFPRLRFHNKSCFDIPFIRSLDANIDNTERTVKQRANATTKKEYNAFIISLGDDEANILMANALIDDIKHEAHTYDEAENIGTTQVIYVNVRNEKNCERINWNACESDKRLSRIKVVLFGKKSDIYSYDNIIFNIDDMEYMYNYNQIADSEELSGKLKNITISNLGSLSDDDIRKLNSILYSTKGDILSAKRKWLSCSIFEKESNNSVRRFRRYYIEKQIGFDRKTSIERKKIFNQLIRTEHVRWNRFSISNGWIFSKEKNKPNKEHDCICPASLLPENKAIYDIINILVKTDMIVD